MRAVDRDRARPAGAAGPIARAASVGLAGAAVLVLVGGVIASTAGLVFVSGVTGAGIGLALSRAAVPSPTALDPDAGPALERRAVVRLAVALACVAVAVGAAGTWVVAVAEGGTLGPIDYLWTTFGPYVPAELLVASVAALWGARSGPVTGR